MGRPKKEKTMKGNEVVADSKEKNLGGRPFREFDQRQFEQLCMVQCTEKEICEIFDTTDKTLNSWCQRTYGDTFRKVYAQKRQGGRSSLRRMQWKKAMEGDTTMLIFLGKTVLGQNERQEIVITNRIDMGSNIANDFLSYDGEEKPSLDVGDVEDATVIDETDMSDVPSVEVGD